MINSERSISFVQVANRLRKVPTKDWRIDGSEYFLSTPPGDEAGYKTNLGKFEVYLRSYGDSLIISGKTSAICFTKSNQQGVTSLYKYVQNKVRRHEERQLAKVELLRSRSFEKELFELKSFFE